MLCPNRSEVKATLRAASDLSAADDIVGRACLTSSCTERLIVIDFLECFRGIAEEHLESGSIIPTSPMMDIRTVLKWFECPHCGRQTSHRVPLDLRLTWAQCESCGKEFVIENDEASKPSA
jgi:predicted RNA-binding Zn-ribbon protein involved in translation (DUF1610 family)